MENYEKKKDVSECYNPGYSGNADLSVCYNPAFVGDTGISECPAPGFVDTVLKPPTAPPPEYEPKERPAITNLGIITEEEIREACLQYASENCCYGKKFVRDTTIPEIHNGCAYHYRLETYTEMRETSPRNVPFKGQFIDGPENGIPPNPWNVVVSIQEMFKDNKVRVEVPHTAYVKECFKCVGNCRVRCEQCRGNGGSACGMCGGVGWQNGKACSMCLGARRIRCYRCSGTGQVRCKECDGCGKLKHFIMLIVTWKNHAEHFVSDTTNLPKELILGVDGRELFKEEQVKVFPIDHCPDPAVNQASTSMVIKHQTSFPSELIRMQKHVLRAIPLTRAQYAWKEKKGEFYVFGFQNKVYFEDYPQKCCCCTCC